MKKKRTALINVIANLLLQIVTLASGFIIPKIILSTFGSEANGLVSSLNQFLNYIALLEGGVNSVIMASLYKPLLEKDNAKVGAIVKTSSNFFRKISYIFAGYTVLLAIIYPLLNSNTPFSFEYISTLVLILSIKLFVQYCFSLSMRNLLNADKKVYIVAFTQALLIIVDTISAVVIAHFLPNLHFLKLATALIFALQPLIFNRYIKKHYSIDKSAPVDKQLLSSRWDGFAINVAYFIHTNTDITIINIFRGLKEASVYSVYALVASGIKQILRAICNGISPSIGKLYAKGNMEELNKKFDMLEYVVFLFVLIVIPVGILLITPFVQIYTSGINDANYYQPLFGTLLLLGEGFYLIREPYIILAYSAGKFKDIRIYAIIEAVLNIVISLILVQPLGLVGIAIGTLIAMVYRTVFQIYYLKNHIVNRPFSKFLKRFAIFAIPATIITILCAKFLPFTEYTVFDWLLHAVTYTLIFVLFYAMISVVFFRSELKSLLAYLSKRK